MAGLLGVGPDGRREAPRRLAEVCDVGTPSTMCGDGYAVGAFRDAGDDDDVAALADVSHHQDVAVVAIRSRRSQNFL